MLEGVSGSFRPFVLNVASEHRFMTLDIVPLFTTLRSFVEKMKVFWALDEKCVLALSEQS